MRNFILTILAATVFWSCDKPLTLKLNQSQSKIVIEGLITNKPDGQYVKVTRVANFYDNGKTPRVMDAIVSVKDDLNNSYTFVHDPDSAGYYFPQPSFVGEVGRTYHLMVVVDGKAFEAEDKMFPVTSIDSLGYKINDDERKEPKEENKFYNILVFAKEPRDTKDYYLFKFYRNDSLQHDNITDIYISDDDFLGENIDGVKGPGFYGIGDSVKVEAYSLTRSGFIFYSDLQNLLTNDGGLFGSPPANSRTNLTNGAIGFFQVSALNSKEKKLE